jgi:hypothetical protein
MGLVTGGAEKYRTAEKWLTFYHYFFLMFRVKRISDFAYLNIFVNSYLISMFMFIWDNNREKNVVFQNFLKY